MNLIYLSPHFPSNQNLYCRNLRQLGATVLGIGDPAWLELRPEQRDSLSDYAQVRHLEDYAAVHAAVAGLADRHGPIDRIDSHNEHWLMMEARLRADFGVPGSRPEEVEEGRRKSRMKERFRRAGVPVARGRTAVTMEGALAFAAEVGYPLVAKPDIGVGAAGTYPLASGEDLARLFETRGNAEYFLEEFVRGTIVTFDGLTDPQGGIAYAASMQYSSGVMEVVRGNQDIYFFTHREIPEDLRELGTRTVREFGIRERFFHIEFFRTDPGRLIGLEVNLRPPGGPSIDMFNHAGEIDLYRAWAEILVCQRAEIRQERPYHCCYVGRKRNIRYRRAHEEVLSTLGSHLVHHTPMPEVFRDAMGDYAYLVRTRTLEELRPLIDCIQGRE